MYETLATALRNNSQGIISLPCQPNSKHLLRGISPKLYAAYPPSLPDYVRWFSDNKNNLAVLAAGELIILDFDTPQNYVKWLVTRAPKTKIVQSRRGYHAYYYVETPVNHTSEICEIKHSGMPIVAPPSVVDGIPYTALGENEITRVARIEDILRDAKHVESAEERGKTSDNGNDCVFSSLPLRNIPTNGLTLVQRIRQALPLSAYLSKQSPRATGTIRFLNAFCPMHEDNERSLSIDQVNGLVKCYSPKCVLHQRVYDVIGLHAVLHNYSNRSAMADLANQLGL